MAEGRQTSSSVSVSVLKAVRKASAGFRCMFMQSLAGLKEMQYFMLSGSMYLQDFKENAFMWGFKATGFGRAGGAGGRV